MLEVHIPSVGPEAEDPRQSPEKGHMVFRVEVLCRGRRHIVQRRYSEFHALHKRIKKLYKVPDFPSKRLPNWRTRGLEQRRQGLEAYIQGVLYLNQDVPKELLEFLSLRHFSTDPKASNWGPTAAHSGSLLFSALGEFLPKNSSSQLHHRPVISFCMDPYVCIPSPEPLSNMVVNGVLQGLYGFSTSSAKAQSEAPCHPAPLPPMP
ncbi:sorting nexin-22 isoform X4 [Herpailurus yagouaroundi]|uniref:sorting nexin-22 isoform X4 n=1 Tax=Herpailurus yagouaroundi TaxID=1608482 RepID=UPI001AD7A9FE|nr:sorting nexin-22 isoform X4 [Puma yagouaroundi]